MNNDFTQFIRGGQTTAHVSLQSQNFVSEKVLFFYTNI